MEGYIGEVRYFASPFAPKSWAYCNGQLLQIRANTALFSILGTVFGGDGVSTFGLPDFRNRVAIGTDNGSLYPLGAKAGNSICFINLENMPQHTHPISGTVTVAANNGEGDTDTPEASYPASYGDESYSNVTNGSLMGGMIHDLALGPAGNHQPFDTLQPVLCLSAVICLNGQFPQRS